MTATRKTTQANGMITAMATTPALSVGRSSLYSLTTICPNPLVFGVLDVVVVVDMSGTVVVLVVLGRPAVVVVVIAEGGVVVAVLV